MPEEQLPPIPLKSIKLNALPKPTAKILREFRVLDPTGKGLTQVKLMGTDDKGKKTVKEGPIIEEKVLARFLAADQTPDKHWIPWMLHLACGGDDARKRSGDALKQIKERFVDERMRGYRDKNGVHREPMGEAEAKQRWEENLDRFKHIIGVADQDMVEKLSIYGWHQAWPGPSRVYENLATAVAKFFKIRKKVVAMNNFMQRQGLDTKVASMVPTGYPTLDALNTTLSRVERFFASRTARRDERADKVYEDENLKIVAPLTYAGAVKLGYNEWPWANRANFEKAMEGTLSSYEDVWRSSTGQQKKVYVYLQFKSPMPCWISSAERRGGGDEEVALPFRRCYMTNLALELEPAQLKNFRPDTVNFHDEENRKTLTLAQVKEAITAEVGRQHNPEEEEYPIYRGPGVYGSPEEAQAVVASLDNGMAAIKEWAKSFKQGSVVSDYLPATNR